MWTISFWKATGERAIKTFAQSLGAIFVAAETGLLDADWIGALSISGMAGLVSLLMSVAGGAKTRKTLSGPAPSFRGYETLPDRG